MDLHYSACMNSLETITSKLRSIRYRWAFHKRTIITLAWILEIIEAIDTDLPQYFLSRLVLLLVLVFGSSIDEVGDMEPTAELRNALLISDEVKQSPSTLKLLQNKCMGLWNCGHLITTFEKGTAETYVSRYTGRRKKGKILSKHYMNFPASYIICSFSI